MTDSKTCPQCNKVYTRADLPHGTNFKRQKCCSSACMHAAKRFTPAQSLAAFWAKVNKTETCWLWTGAKNEFGYGMATMNQVKNQRAHRVSYELAYGAIPNGLWALHKCDTPACIRPDHLFLGTNDENRADCIAKGRYPRGTDYRRAKLDDDKVREIRRLHKEEGATYDELKVQFGVSRTQIRTVCTGAGWKHVQ